MRELRGVREPAPERGQRRLLQLRRLPSSSTSPRWNLFLPEMRPAGPQTASFAAGSLLDHAPSPNQSFDCVHAAERLPPRHRRQREGESRQTSTAAPARDVPRPAAGRPKAVIIEEQPVQPGRSTPFEWLVYKIRPCPVQTRRPPGSRSSTRRSQIIKAGEGVRLLGGGVHLHPARGAYVLPVRLQVAEPPDAGPAPSSLSCAA